VKLYEITGEMRNIQEMIDDNVPLEQLEETIKQIEIDFEDKAKSVLFVIANIEAEIELCKAEESKLAARRKAKDNQVSRLKEYLLYNMQEFNSGKIDNGVRTASVRKGAPALSIVDEDKIPNEYKKIKTSISVDKKLLLKSLKELDEGDKIEGAEVIQGKNTLTIK